MATKTRKPTTAKRNSTPKALRKIAAAISWGSMATFLQSTPLPSADINLPKAPQLRTWTLPGIDW